jgi:hypothetical protein
VIRLLLLWCLCGQGANWPVLPPALQQRPEVVAAYQEQLQSQDPEARRAAALLVLEQLPQAELAAQADFVLELYATSDFPADLLPAEMRRIYLAWPQLEQHLIDVLRSPEGENLERIQGALIAAGQLELASPALVESIGARLNQPAYQVAASTALEQITRHPFRTLESFHDWWKTARDLNRLDWMAQALNKAQQAELQLWRKLLEADPNMALGAIDDLRKEIRSLGYEALARIAANAKNGKVPNFEIASFRKAYDAETDSALRVQLLRMVPRFFQGAEAIGFVEEAMASHSNIEKECAASILLEVRPQQMALEASVKYFQQAYQPLANGKAGTPVMREALVTSMISLARSQAVDLVESQPKINETFPIALEQEKADDVVPHLYEAVGLFGEEHFLLTMLGRVSSTDRSIGQRQAALEATIQIARRFNKVDSFLDEFMADLLANETSGIRYKAMKAAGNLKHEKCTILLLQRLMNEPEEGLKRELLKVSRAMRASGAVDLLLKFEPPVFWNEYRDALEFQIGGDLPLIQQSLNVVVARQDWELAWRLMRAFPLPADATPEMLAPFRALQAQIQAEWVLALEPKPKADNPDVLEAISMLQSHRQADGSNSLWPQLHGRVLTLLAQHADAFLAYTDAIGKTEQGPGYDALALDAVRAAEAAGLLEEASQFMAGLKPLAGEKAQAELATFRSKIDKAVAASKPVAAETESEGEVKATPPAQPADDGAGDGAAAGAGNAETKPAEAPGGDKPSDQPKPEQPKPEQTPPKEGPPKSEDPDKPDGSNNR